MKRTQKNIRPLNHTTISKIIAGGWTCACEDFKDNCTFVHLKNLPLELSKITLSCEIECCRRNKVTKYAVLTQEALDNWGSNGYDMLTWLFC